VVAFVIVVALINLCVGYGLAVGFGYGPPDLWATWIALGPDPIASEPAASCAAGDGLSQRVIPGPKPTPAAPPGNGGKQASEPAVLQQDPLTGLLNRVGLEAALQSWSAEGFHQAHSVLATLFQLNGLDLIDTDDGPGRGEQVLCEIGKRLRQWNQPIDLVGRCADDRFLVVAVDTDEPSAVRRAEQTRQLIEDLLPDNRSSSRSQLPAVQVTTARFAAGDTPAALLARLEAALGEARSGVETGELAAAAG
jgi:diguanylate cyclase (GGDEF)-like protein